MDDFIIIVKCLVECGLLAETVSKTIENEVKWQKGNFLAGY